MDITKKQLDAIQQTARQNSQSINTLYARGRDITFQVQKLHNTVVSLRVLVALLSMISGTILGTALYLYLTY